MDEDNPRRRGTNTVAWKGTLAAIAIAVSLGACSAESPTPANNEPSNSPPVSDTSEAACSKFPEVSAGAFGESMSFEQIVSGLKEVGDLGTTATNSKISGLAIQAGEEANARALISGKPDPTLDALAEACNKAFPI
jgi:hypothetical protein